MCRHWRRRQAWASRQYCCKWVSCQRSVSGDDRHYRCCHRNLAYVRRSQAGHSASLDALSHLVVCRGCCTA